MQIIAVVSKWCAVVDYFELEIQPTFANEAESETIDIAPISTRSNSSREYILWYRQLIF